MKINLLLLLLGISLACFAQEQTNCSCTLNLKEIIADIETNYPGFAKKTNNGHLRGYLSVKKKALAEAQEVRNRENCFYLIERYISFFKDNHIIFDDRQSMPSPARVIYNTKAKGKKDGLTGLWRRSADSLTIQIIKVAASQYSAHLVANKKDHNSSGNIHFTLTGNDTEFRIRKHANWLTTAQQRGRRLDHLLIEPDGIWEKIIPGKLPSTRPTKLGSYNTQFTSQLLNEDTFYLGIPAFNINEKKFDSLIVNEIIPAINVRKVKHLVIDLRNNVGGNGSFLSLIRLVYDRPFSLPGDFLYDSPALIYRYQNAADKGSAQHRAMLAKLISHKGGFVQKDSLRVKIKETLEYPTKVSILVNENCASSTEYFLILAKHSSKVKLFGRNTSGTLDYSELLSPERLSCPGYIYMRPTSKSFYVDRQGIDQKGIVPDMDLSSYPDDQWIEVVLNNSQR